jgi:hypothetical protein
VIEAPLASKPDPSPATTVYSPPSCYMSESTLANHDYQQNLESKCV